MIAQHESLKKALRKIGKNIETHGMLSPSDFTNEDVSLLYSLAVNLYEREEYNQAKDIFQRLLLSRPYEIKFWYALGACSQMERSFEEALNAYSMASLIDDHDPRAYFHASECLYLLDEIEEAKKALKGAKERMMTRLHEPLREKIISLETALTKK